MANRFLTRDEVVLEIGVPMFRAMLTDASAAAIRKADGKPVICPNPIRDLVPVSFSPEMLTVEGLRDNLAALGKIEENLRARAVQP